MFQVPPACFWREQIEQALAREGGRPQAAFVHVATVRPDGRPASRVMVFRGFDDQAGEVRLLFATDVRSAKVGQVGRRPWAEASWYFDASREQFRLLGRATVIGPDADPAGLAIRGRAWLGLSEAARRAYGWPPPGSPLGGTPDPSASPPGNLVEPLATFGVLALEPVEVDRLVLPGSGSDAPQRRWIFRRDDGGGAWTTWEIYP